MTISSMLLAYPVMLETKEGNNILVSFPDVPEALTEGTTKQEALTEAKDCLIAALDGYIEGHRQIPQPSAENELPLVVLPALFTARIAVYRLYRAMYDTIGRRRAGQAVGNHGKDDQAAA